uniref:Putative secreted protein n=1 Tax=Anopheles darlingi TaxID=43151 RepID=A0A2M4D4Z8_ANODA
MLRRPVLVVPAVPAVVMVVQEVVAEEEVVAVAVVAEILPVGVAARRTTTRKVPQHRANVARELESCAPAAQCGEEGAVPARDHAVRA